MPRKRGRWVPRRPSRASWSAREDKRETHRPQVQSLEACTPRKVAERCEHRRRKSLSLCERSTHERLRLLSS